MTDRRRNSVVLLAVLILLGAGRLTIAAKKTREGLDLKGGVQLIYQGKPTAQSKVTAESLNRAIDIMRKRVDQLGVSEPEIQRFGASEIDVALPEVKDIEKAEREVGTTAQLLFYDWEPNVIGPTASRRRPKPASPAGREAGCLCLRPDRVPGGAARGETARRTAPQRHDLGERLHAAAGQRLPLRQLVPARHQERKDGVPG